MARTEVRGGQIKDSSVQRDDLDVATVGQAVVRKIIGGTGVSLSSTGADAGTGDVTVNATGASQTPWTSDIDAAGFALQNASAVETEDTATGASTTAGVLSSADSSFSVSGVSCEAEHRSGATGAAGGLSGGAQGAASGFDSAAAEIVLESFTAGQDAQARLVALADEDNDAAHARLKLLSFDLYAREDEPGVAVVETGFLVTPINRRTVTASATLEINDAGKTIDANHATVAIALTIPDNATVPYRIGTRIPVRRTGAAAVTFAAAGGVTIRNNVGVLPAQYTQGYLEKVATNEWDWVRVGPIDDTAYGSAWDGSLDPPTKNAVYDKIETLSTGVGLGQLMALGV